MMNFKIVRHLKPSDFRDHKVWSEYYDFDELEELRTWGVHEKYINELLQIAEKGESHPYYTVPETMPLPDRMRIFIYTIFFTPTGRKLEGFIINPDPFVIGIFCHDEIEGFNPNLMEFWMQSEENVRTVYNVGSEPIFPLKYKTNFRDSEGKIVEGSFGSRNA